MTRETKIGLLVGLAFIIVIGILLSDHLTSSTEPPPATLANAGSNVMQALNTPGGAQVPAVTSAAPPQQVTPNQTVPTNADLTPQPTPVQIVQIGPGSNPQTTPPISVQAQEQPQPRTQANAQPSPVVTMPPQPEQTTASQQPAQVAQQTNNDEDSPIITQVPQNVDRSLAQAAQRNGEGLVALDGAGRPNGNAAAISWTQALTGMREHKAEPGDSVSKWAKRYMGGNTSANRAAIIAANPSLQADPNKVIVGKTYAIPAPAGEAPVAQQQPQQQPQQPQQQIETAAGPTVVSAAEYVYTVKEGDTLWKIAEAQLGDANARTAIKELNKLPDENRIHVGMKLKMPGRPVAQATNQ